MVRKLNEDSSLDRGEVGMWVVADGMGGHAAGDVASQLIVNTLAKIEPSTDLGEFVNRVEDGVLEVNDRLVKTARETRQTSGSTVVVLLIVGRHYAFLWAGDSRLYRLRGSQLQQLSRDHSQVEMYVEQGLLTREEAIGHPAANMVTRAVGASPDLFLDVDVGELTSGDRFLLCSDGLDKHLADEEIAELLANDDTRAAAQAMIDLTLSRGANDNVTVSIVAVEENAATDWDSADD
jgi:serine/threonine protein phosphatase PrpC